MTLQFSKTFTEQRKRLAPEIQKKLRRQLKNLQADFRHPSLFARKMPGSEVYEARVDYHFRFTYLAEGEIVYVLGVGTHDTGLGKK